MHPRELIILSKNAVTIFSLCPRCANPPKYNALGKEDITGYAKALGLNLSKFGKSLENREIQKTINQDRTQVNIRVGGRILIINYSKWGCNLSAKLLNVCAFFFSLEINIICIKHQREMNS